VDLDRAEEVGMTSEAIERALGPDSTSAEISGLIRNADGTNDDVANNLIEEFKNEKSDVDQRKAARKYM